MNENISSLCQQSIILSSLKTQSFLYILFISLVLCLQGCEKFDQSSTCDLVNPLIGNESYKFYFGKELDANSNEFTRVKAHVRYVEELLRSRDISHLDAEKQKMRIQLLDILRVLAKWSFS